MTSPSPTALIQTKGPWGRGWRVWPSFSRQRLGCSLALFFRRLRCQGKIGVMRAVAPWYIAKLMRPKRLGRNVMELFLHGSLPKRLGIQQGDEMLGCIAIAKFSAAGKAFVPIGFNKLQNSLHV